MAPVLRRHDLAWLRPGAACHADGLDGPAAAWLRHWLAEGKPLVVTRQQRQHDGDESMRLGTVLPARLGRRRIACTVAAKDVLDIGPPLNAEAVAHVLPADVADALHGLAQQARQLDVPLGVYGSTAWEHLAGETYRRAESDVDMVCDVRDAATLPGILLVLARASRSTRIDGEIRFPDGKAVAWRELQASGLDPDAQVLVKDLHGVELVRVGSLTSTLA